MFSYDTDTGVINIYDEIGSAWWGGIDAEAVSIALDAMKGQPVTIRLNTPGGSVDEGIAIYNLLKRYPGGVNTVVDSLAASMGSYLLQAGKVRTVASNAMVMVHDPWTIAMGNSTELRKVADITDKYAARMIPDYAKRSGKTEDEIKVIMADESWYTGQEAVDAGFADAIEVESNVEPVVAGLRHIARKVPDSLKQRQMAAGDRTQFPKRHAAKASGITLAQAKEMALSVR